MKSSFVVPIRGQQNEFFVSPLWIEQIVFERQRVVAIVISIFERLVQKQRFQLVAQFIEE